MNTGLTIDLEQGAKFLAPYDKIVQDNVDVRNYYNHVLDTIVTPHENRIHQVKDLLQTYLEGLDTWGDH